MRNRSKFSISLTKLQKKRDNHINLLQQTMTVTADAGSRVNCHNRLERERAQNEEQQNVMNESDIIPRQGVD